MLFIEELIKEYEFKLAELNNMRISKFNSNRSEIINIVIETGKIKNILNELRLARKLIIKEQENKNVVI